MQQSISQLLRQKRLERNLSLDEIAHTIRIRQPFLQALEDGDFGALPSLVQARGFLRSYAEFLGLDADALLEQLGQKHYQRATNQFKTAMHQPYQDIENKEYQHDPFYNPAPSINLQEQESFKNIGAILQKQRQNLGLSLEEVEAQTLIRIHYIKALENGDFNNLPSSVQGRGMLSNYAKFLGLNEEELLLLYADGLQKLFASKKKIENAQQNISQHHTVITRKTPLSLTKQILSSDILWAVIFSLLLVGFIGWGIYTIYIYQSPKPAIEKPPSVVEVLLITATPTVSPTLSTFTPTSPGVFYPTIIVTQDSLIVEGQEGTTIAREVPGKIQVNLVARMRTWMRVVVDGQVQFEGRTKAGNAYAYSALNQIEVVTGNAAALQVFYNNQDLGVMGYQNQVVNRIYTAEGVILPTATITLTPTITPTPTATLKATQTPLPTTTSLPTQKNAETQQP